jgi:hypothetical protein
MYDERAKLLDFLHEHKVSGILCFLWSNETSLSVDQEWACVETFIHYYMRVQQNDMTKTPKVVANRKGEQVSVWINGGRVLVSVKQIPEIVITLISAMLSNPEGANEKTTEKPDAEADPIRDRLRSHRDSYSAIHGGRSSKTDGSS